MASAENPSASGSDQGMATPQETAASAGAPPAGVQPPSDPPPGAGVQALPDTPIPLPPPVTPPPVDYSGFLARLGGVDYLLIGLVLLFAFVTASFPVGNSDFLMHLATGRLLTQGQLSFGVDPFTYTAQGYWVHHSWLFDLVSYNFYRLTGNVAVLVVLKALAVVLLAGLMLQLSHRPGKRWWLPAACTLLALLAMSPRLYLQPAVVSVVLLGVTVWLIERRRLWLVPVVCLLWVNLDSWFVLGPLTVALYLLAGLLPAQGEGSAANALEADRRPLPVSQLGLVLVVSLLACLVNPHHVRAFTLPAILGLDQAANVLGQDPQLRGLFIVPWEKIYFQPNIGLNAAGLAYFPLVFAGLMSFSLTYGSWSWSRVLLFGTFFALSLTNSRLIPFFAVVAGPITALNFFDYADEIATVDLVRQPGWRAWLVWGRVLTLVLGLALVVLSIPNWWIQSAQQRSRRVGWNLEVDPGLRDAALKIKDWREQGLIEPGQRWFTTSPELVSYLAWYCPGEATEKGFLDQRLSLFGAVASDYRDACRDFNGEADPRSAADQTAAPPAWPRVFAQHKIRFLLYHTHNLGRLQTATMRLHSNPEQWVPCFREGQTAIFAWLGPQGPQQRTEMARIMKMSPESWDYLEGDGQATRKLGLNYEQLAFGSECEPAPPHRPGPRPTWYEELWLPPPGESPDVGTAVQDWARFPAQSYRYAQDSQRAWMGQMAGWLIGSSALTCAQPEGPLGALLAGRVNAAFVPPTPPSPDTPPPPPQKDFDQWLEFLVRNFQAGRDAGPPSSPYLAIRAARRALAVNPDNPHAYINLAQAYVELRKNTRERTISRGYEQPFMHVEMIRHAQVASALQALLKLDPRPEFAQLAHRWLLENVYTTNEFLEPQVHHIREYLALCRTLNALPGVPPEKFAEAMSKSEADFKKLERQLKNKQDEYEVKAANKPPLQRAQIALEHGLIETSVKLLMETPTTELVDPRNPREATGAAMAIDLMLLLGRLDDARDSMTPPDPNTPFNGRVLGTHRLGMPAFEWFQAQLAAASGDYEEADKYLAEAIKVVQKNPSVFAILGHLDVTSAKEETLKEGSVAEFVGLGVGDLLLRQATYASGMGWPIHLELPYQIQEPHRPQPGNWRARLMQLSQTSTAMIQQVADLQALRAWVALEAGNLPRSQEQVDAFLSATRLSPQVYLAVRAGPLVGLVQELLGSGKAK